MTFSPTPRQIVLQEVFDEASVPTDEEIYDYALKIGINVETEPHLLYLARDGLMEALPPGWKPCYDEDRKEIYYFNFTTSKAQWEHPLDEIYRSLVKKVRGASAVTVDQIDDDSQTSIKEDLKSFEEASLILPSSEMYPKPKVLEPLSPLGLGAFRKSPTSLSVMKRSNSKDLLKGCALKLSLEVHDDTLAEKNSESELNPLKKITFDEGEVRKRPNSSDIRNRRNIGPMEFRHLSKQEIMTPKNCGKNSFLNESKKLGDISRVTDIHATENKTSESVVVTKDEGYATEFSVSSLGDKEADGKINTSKKELTLAGGGSIFLKTNKNKFSPSSDLVSLTFSKEELSEGLGSSLDGKKSNSDIDAQYKGILRDQKHLSNKENDSSKILDGLKSTSQKSLEEDRKSVRFQLEKDLKINFGLPDKNYVEAEDSSFVDKQKMTTCSPTKKSYKIDSIESTKQIELDFEDLEIDLMDSLAGDDSKRSISEPAIEQPKIPLTLEIKTVKPKKFKSSQTLVQGFREIFEIKDKIKIPTSTQLKIDEVAAKNCDESKADINQMSIENNGAISLRCDKSISSNKSSARVAVEDLKPFSHNLIDLCDLDETKESSSVGDSQIDSGKTDHSFHLKDEIFDSDFAGIVDFAFKKKYFEGANGPKSESPRDLPLPEPRSIYGEKNNLVDDLLKIDETNVVKTGSKINGEQLELNVKSKIEGFEKKEEEVSGRYEKRKSEKIKNLEASFNEWLSETEKLFEEKKSNTLIKMKEKFEDWKTNRESEFAKMYNKKTEEETQNKFKELRNEFLKKEQEEVEKLKSQFESEKTEKLSRLKVELEMDKEKEIERMKKILEDRLNDEKLKLLEKHKEEMEKIEKSLQEVIIEKESYKMKEMEIARESERAVQEMQQELKESYQKQKSNLINEHELLLDSLRQQHAVAIENLRIEFKNEEEGLRKCHADRIDELKIKLSSLEARKLDNQKSNINENRIYEKVRCEKRLLEDKYNTLKEKYIRLKSDAKSTLDRKNKKDTAAGSETEKSSSNKSNSIFRKNGTDAINCKRNYENDKKAKLKKPFANLDNVGQYTSTEEEENINSRNTSSLLSPTEVRKLKKSPDSIIKNKKNEERSIICDNGKDESRSDLELKCSEELKKNHTNETKKRRLIFSRLKAASTSRINFQNRTQDKDNLSLSPVENLRRQLKKLEELEDQFPMTTHTDTYMRYPFTDIPQVGSSEIEFFKHRIHLERESIRRAKESLKSQKKNFETRQREVKQKLLERGPETKFAMEQVYQEERELTDMEVSVHRTRALLGEKIIRLRHLEQSLKRISEPRKKESFMNKDILSRLGFRSQTKEDDRTLSDLSSHSGSSGFSSTDFNITDPHNTAERGWARANVEESRRQFKNNMHESSEIIQSLENLNSEICEIWEVLKKQHQSGQTGTLLLPPPPLFYGEAGWPTFSINPSIALRNTVITSHKNIERSVTQQLKNQVTGSPNFGHVTTTGVDSSLVDRTRNLRDWLKAARNSSMPSEIISPNQVTL